MPLTRVAAFQIALRMKLHLKTWNDVVTHGRLHFKGYTRHGYQHFFFFIETEDRSCTHLVLDYGGIHRHKSLIAGKLIYFDVSFQKDRFNVLQYFIVEFQVV